MQLNTTHKKFLSNNQNRRKVTLWDKIVHHRYLYIMALPMVAIFIIFKYLPIYGLLLAFKDFRYREGILKSPWVGLQNFKTLFGPEAFQNVVINTLTISFGRIVFTFFVPVIFALLLNEMRNMIFKRVVQTFIYLPHFLSWVIISGILYSLLTINGGFVNKILISFFDLEPVNFLLEPPYFRPIVYLSYIWKEAGWGSIIYLAALASINPEMYEAATIDGANRFQKMIYVTWPGIKNTVVVMLILTTSLVMFAGFDQIFNLYSPPVYEVGDIIDTYVYREYLLKGKFGLGTAAGLFQAVVNLVVVIIVNAAAKKINEGEGLF